MIRRLSNSEALAALRIAVGVMFLIFAQYKVFGTQFTLGGGFQGWIHSFISDGAYPFMRGILSGFVLRHGTAIAFLVAYGEMAIGIALVSGICVRTASMCGAVFMVTLLLSANYPGPDLPLWRYVGSSLEHSVFLLCFLAFALSDAAQLWSIPVRLRRRRADPGLIKAFCGLAVALALLFGMAVPAGASALTRQEQRIAAAAAVENAPAIVLLEELVNINSGTMNFAGVERVGRIMMAELEPLGFTVRWKPMTLVGRSGLVLAEHRGTGHGRRMLLIGHLDTVFEQDSPFQHFERRGNTAEGPGVNDMKDGLAIMVGALRALHRTGALRDADVSIVLSGDEEDAGSPLAQARADLIEAGKHADVALEFEALASEHGHDMGTVCRRGDLAWVLRTTAKSGHSSGIFSADAGFGAAYELARILDAFRRELAEPNATFNVGLVLGGANAAMNGDSTGGTASGKTNVIPAQGLARGDLRTLSGGQTERMSAKMRAIVAAHLPGTDASIEFEEGYPAMAPTAGNRALLARLNEINAALGLEPMAELEPLKRGAGDISFVADRLDGLVGFGAVGEGSHAPGETVDLSSFDRQLKRTALLIERLARERRP